MFSRSAVISPFPLRLVEGIWRRKFYDLDGEVDLISKSGITCALAPCGGLAVLWQPESPA
jgi:hypothetical protein